ncbi:hypothetical protein J2X69_001328 [Algoriphagus sp. 4150]|uniref:hypothetical protein n=1 Tax=Algoriphagus sp. 4150 TaxID=2817756 RepID=UPI002856514B|nr:hypothetical protein [Algoriphagus sp. 4150]MDR7128993.1 hypothetical protein [Algoriphagus sp. 4150]
MKLSKNLILLAAISLGFSCGSSENESPVDSALIVGGWDMESYEYSISTKMTYGEEVFETFNRGVATESDAQVIFSESPNTYSGKGSYVILLTAEVDGESFEEEIKLDNLFQDGTWEISGDKLIVDNSSQPSQEITIAKLNANSLVLKFLEESTVDYPGSTIVSKREGTATYTRN